MRPVLPKTPTVLMMIFLTPSSTASSSVLLRSVDVDGAIRFVYVSNVPSWGESQRHASHDSHHLSTRRVRRPLQYRACVRIG
jgi:hypothetical protein